ncbi:MAG TPA: glucose-6-phosphate dehydrogenase [Candidatus Saccharimonadales bacterium]|nr:glucose-6-phosphate dehydrogenase [Candidatus Saccharimonadales bacterium]
MVVTKIGAHKNVPTILILLGVTGDLAAKKIIPALYDLFTQKMLPHQFAVVGVGRRGWDDAALRAYLAEVVGRHAASPADLDQFVGLFRYHEGQFQDAGSYQRLGRQIQQIDDGWGLCSNKLFYLSVSPGFYELIITQLAQSGLTEPCSDETGWTRVLIEKPFGQNQATARQLDELLARYFKESQIYRIDHYLAKEMLQNMMAFRFSNNLFETTWNNASIERIQIRLWEQIGAEKRGVFYDGVGALRDVGQNHLLQMLAFVTMDQPGGLTDKAIRASRRQVLEALEIPDSTQIKHRTYRAQYQGYRDIEGVEPDSSTETYFKVKAYLNTPQWQGVPIVMESGKRMSQARKDITVTFKHPSPCLCPPGEHYQNKIVFALEPEEGVKLHFWSKQPGLEYGLEERTLDFLLRGPDQPKSQYTEEYEKLLLDCIMGDQTLFISTAEVRAMWRFVDPIVAAWDKGAVPLEAYQPDTIQPSKQSAQIDQPAAADGLARTIGVVGLGKMGAGLAARLAERGWQVLGYNRTAAVTKGLAAAGVTPTYSLEELVKRLPKPRLVWIMLTAGKPVDAALFGSGGLVQFLEPGDIIIDGGNTYYQDTVKRAAKLAKHNLIFLDAGVSGGPGGARNGACIMVGGDKNQAHKLAPLWRDLTVTGGYQIFDGAGAGHFVKMVHNGIEYGMMQAIAEGFTIMKQAHYSLDLEAVADIYNHGSVIESRLVAWLEDAFKLYGQDLDAVSGTVAYTGEGHWTIKTAKELQVKAKVIEAAAKFRKESVKNPDYTGQILSALRNQFGGHSIGPLEK